MKQLPNYGDRRQVSSCVYCAGSTDTDDHVPSRVLLDDPYPENLHVVPCCPACNSSFSLDEQYLACLIDCVVSGSADPAFLQRQKTARILREQPKLAARLEEARQDTEDGLIWRYEHARVENVVLKLARGHAAYELNEPQREAPAAMSFYPLATLDEAMRQQFEVPPEAHVWPEVGSRAMHRLLVANDSPHPGWVSVQNGRYRYMTAVHPGPLVRIVLSEYLGVEVIWE